MSLANEYEHIIQEFVYMYTNKERMGDNMPFIGYKNRGRCFPVFIEIILVCI